MTSLSSSLSYRRDADLVLGVHVNDVPIGHGDEDDHDIETFTDDDHRHEDSQSLVEGESELPPEQGVKFLVLVVALMEARLHLKLVVNELWLVQLAVLVVVYLLAAAIAAVVVAVVVPLTVVVTM